MTAIGRHGEDTSRYLPLVAELSLGKRLPQAVYVHREMVPHLPAALVAIITHASLALTSDEPWNVLKLYAETAKVSFLWYPLFFEEPFPALAASVNVDVSSGTATRREYGDENPPILHRKETLLPPSHPAIAKAAALTTQAERFGLFEASHEVGRRLEWEARIRRVGLSIDGHDLVQGCHYDGPIYRHRTALARTALSTPMRMLWRHGFLEPPRSVFDYGCGRGDDIRTLKQHGLDVTGWDPHFASAADKRAADVVNLGFVLNVIEDQSERAAALAGAWSLTNTVLSIAVLISGRDVYERCRLFNDGILTSRGTFQKYFAPAEFQAYLEVTLGREPIILAPGIAFVFRDDVEEQSFISRRVRRRASVTSAPRPIAAMERAPKAVRALRERKADKWELNCIRPTVTIWLDEAADATTSKRCETSYVTATRTAWPGACCSAWRAASQARGRSSAARSAGQSAAILSYPPDRHHLAG